MNSEKDAPQQKKNTNNCVYCGNVFGGESLLCLECNGRVHIKCLKQCTPGDLLGDVFFNFTCAHCVDTQCPTQEKLVRQPLPWLLVITLALYNLSVKSKGLSHNGYFHWRQHIVTFIDKNWDFLFEPQTRRRKNWIGSVSGALSHNNPDFFLSGQAELHEPGWWKLTHAKHTPAHTLKVYEELCERRQKLRTARQNPGCSRGNAESTLLESDAEQRDDSVDESGPEELCSRLIPYMGRKPKFVPQARAAEQKHPQAFNTVQSSLMEFLAENLSNDANIFSNLPQVSTEPNLLERVKSEFLPLDDVAKDSDLLPSGREIKIESPDDSNNEASRQSDVTCTSGYFRHTALEEETSEGEVMSNDFLPSYASASAVFENENDEQYQPRIVRVTNFQQVLHTDDSARDHKELLPGQDYDESAENAADDVSNEEHVAVEDLQPCKKSLFTKRVRRNWPWLAKKERQAMNDSEGIAQGLTAMTKYHEAELLSELRQVMALESKCELEIPSFVRRFYRKLCMRQWRREHGKDVFNLDEHLDLGQKKLKSSEESKIIDRYHLASTLPDKHKSFYARIAGNFEYEPFESPYTHRVLHPFIYRNKECFPAWLKLLCELKCVVNGFAPQRSPIDFCYVRPNHIAAINSLLQSSFWPGIDISECLSYPDYSIVAMYKKLVIGCGFLVPDVGFNEAYISFMAVRPGWQRCGIATFMLYHLIQTCMSKDITLHVSATNPAVVLYQKFGFKIEEVILNFYEKYLPANSNQSRHAFFLRLMR